MTSTAALSALARSMQLASMRAPESGVYIVQDVCELSGPVSGEALRASFKQVCAPLKRVEEVPWLELATAVDLEQFLRTDQMQDFDLSGPLLRVAVQRDAEACTVVLTAHHSLLDGISMTTLWCDWLSRYAAEREGRTCDSAALQWMAGGETAHISAEAQQFWLSYLEGTTDDHNYIVDHTPHPDAGRIPAGTGRERVSLPGEKTAALKAFAREQGVTINNLLQAAWAFLLSSYSGHRDVIFGVTRSGRRADLHNERSLGLYARTLPLRIKVDGTQSVHEYLRQVQAQWRSLRDFEQTPLEHISAWMNWTPGIPPFGCLMNYYPASPEHILRSVVGPWKGLSFRRLQRTDIPLTLTAYEQPELTLELVYDARSYQSGMMTGALRHIQGILAQFLAQPESAISEVTILASAERSRLYGGQAPEPLPVLAVHELFEMQARRSPNSAALASPNEVLSYGELYTAANRLANFLTEKGATRHDLIAFCLPASFDSVVAVLAILKTGAGFLPIDSSLPAKRVGEILADAQPRLILCNAQTSPLCDRFPGLVELDRMKAEVLQCSPENKPPDPDPEGVAYVIYTSGSTGQPKGVVLSHRALLNHTLAAPPVFGITETDRRLQFAGTGSDVFIAEVFNYLSCGATLVFGWRRGDGGIRDFVSFLRDQKITVTGMPGSWWKEWAEAMRTSNLPEVPSLRAVITGMERADPKAAAVCKQHLGPGVRLFNAYGPTETSPTATIYEFGTSVWESEECLPIGKPLQNTSAYVLDRFGHAAPAGVAAEIYIGGSGVATGYLNQPERTSERFQSGVYRTGDLGFVLPDGNLAFLGRADRQVKVRGYRIELEEIERVLSAHSGVSQASVVLSAEGTPRLLAFVCVRPGAETASEDLRAYVGDRLPPHMVPATVTLLDELPRLSSGKVDLAALPALENRQKPVAPKANLPLSGTEQRLASIWTGILAIPGIAAQDNFFELGGDSLAITRLVLEIEAAFGKLISPALLYRAPTLTELASRLDGTEVSAEKVDPIWPSLVPLQPHGAKRAFFCFPGADDDPDYFRFLAQSIGQDQPFYVVRDSRPHTERGLYTVEQQAKRFLDEIRSFQPAGPYHLGGHCFGGLIAFEAARQLVESGERVGSVVLIEVPAPGYPRVLRSWRKYGLLAGAVLSGRRRLTFAEIVAHLRVWRTLLRKRLTSTNRRLLVDAGLTAVAEPIEKHWQPTVHPNTQAGRSYAPKPLIGDLAHVIAKDEHHSTEILEDPRLGWKEFTRGRCKVLQSPGRAAEIFRPPYVTELAKHVKAALDSRS